MVSCASRLADQFESRYGYKLGGFLDDVASVDSPPTWAESPTVPVVVDCSGDNGSTASMESSSSLYSSVPVVPGEDAQTRLHSLLSELFQEKINWGRVVGMLTLLRTLCHMAETRNAHEDNATAQNSRSAAVEAPVS